MPYAFMQNANREGLKSLFSDENAMMMMTADDKSS